MTADLAWGLIPERRRVFEDRTPNEYLLIPAVASIPGAGTFVGVIASASNLGDTGINLGAAVAESIDGSDIGIQAVALQEVPLLVPGLTLDFQVADLQLGQLDVFVPGRNSPNFTIPISAEFRFFLLQPTLRLFDRRVLLYYSLGFFRGFDFDDEGNEATFASHSASWQTSFDFTDDVVDPRKGMRLAYTSTLPAPERSFLGDNTGDSAFGANDGIRTEDVSLTFYFPFTDRLNLAWNNRFFRTFGGDSSDPGNVISGGSPPLRGFPAGRWTDRFAVFHGFDLRYNFPIGRNIDVLLARGVLEDLQAAVFYEVGQVAPNNNSELWEDMHYTYGAGFRVLLQAIVLRLDLAIGNEGAETHLTIDHAF